MLGSKKNETDSYIYLDNETEFQGRIHTSRVLLEGTIRGSVYASQEIRLKPGSVLQGDIHTGRILIEEGAAVNSEITMDGADAGNRPQDSVRLPGADGRTTNGTAVPAKLMNA